MRGRFNDLTSQVFTWWTVLSFAGRGESYDAKWLCRCKCGVERVVFAISLRNGQSKSCGCYNRKNTSMRMTTHGETKVKRTKEYAAWISAKGRCFNENDPKYHRYGGRGITMCDTWKDSYETFLKDMGRAPRGLSIERINNEGNYEPSNCRWATPKEQANNRSTNIDY